MSDETPTERFQQPTTPLPQTAGAVAAEPGKRQQRGMLIALIAIVAAVLVALIVVIVLLVGNANSNSAQPAPDTSTSASDSPAPEESESPEPSEEPSEEPSDDPSESPSAPPAPPQSPSFATFVGPSTASCPDTSGAVAITWSWSSTNAVNAWFGIGTNNAKAEPFESVPTTATYTFNYQCSEASQRYTVTLEDSAGRLTHSTVIIVRQ